MVVWDLNSSGVWEGVVWGQKNSTQNYLRILLLTKTKQKQKRKGGGNISQIGFLVTLLIVHNSFKKSVEILIAPFYELHVRGVTLTLNKITTIVDVSLMYKRPKKK